MFQDFTKSLHNVIDRIEDYGSSTVEFYKLRLFKSVMKGSVSLVNLLVYGSLSLFVLLFLSIGVALWLGTFFEDIFVGFLLVGAFYGLLLIFMFVIGRKVIERKILYEFSGLFFDEDEAEPEEKARNEVAEFMGKTKEETFNNVVEEDPLTNEDTMVNRR